MKKKWILAFALLTAFALWTVALCYIDVQPIGPRESSVGFAALNGFVHRLTGVNMTLYTITDWLGLVPVVIGFGFAILGLVQWIKRKNILKVDSDILILGVFYILVLAVYILFETVIINRRPVLINGYLETSYPSSTTLLVLCVMPTAALQFRNRTKGIWKKIILAAIAAFVVFVIGGRLLSGVHWFSDIVGGILLAGGLVMLYDTTCRLF
jgi:undecaprenyl-diphosphatase